MVSLRRKLAYQLIGLILSLLLLGAAAIWGINGMNASYTKAMKRSESLQKLTEVGPHLQAAHMLLMISDPQPAGARQELLRASELFERSFPSDPQSSTAELEQAVRSAMQSAVDSTTVGQIRVEDVNPVLRPLLSLDGAIRQEVIASQEDADRNRRFLMISMNVLLAGIGLGGTLIGMSQYRSVVWPLLRMKLAVERIASGRFNGRVDTTGTAEFAELAANFNIMAARLEDMYHTLQQRVEAKSKQLLRNERLASVGLLAAGVAHEINNPLSIMTAHAELSLEAIERGDASAHDESARSMVVICEEAFRCKRIVEKLLSLGRGQEESPTVFPLGELVREVVQTVAAMPNYQTRKLIMEHSNGTVDLITGRSDEMKQVVLNLLFNGLEATPTNGQVRVAIKGDRREVEISITDSGRGMSNIMLEKIFEPFYTDPSGKTPASQEARRGLGLGLSIAHAIVVRHGGEIRAASDGPGKGSKFTVILPAASLKSDQEQHQDEEVMR